MMLIFNIGNSNQTYAQNAGVLTSENPNSCFIGDWDVNRSIVYQINLNNPKNIFFKAYLYKDDTLKIETVDSLVQEFLAQTIDTFYPEHFFFEGSCEYYDNFDDYLFELGTGRLPSGNYKFKIITYEDNSPNSTQGFKILEDSVEFQIAPSQSAGLISPYNNSKINFNIGSQVLFSWTELIPDPGIPVQYEIIIKDKLPGQTVHEAWKFNIPVYSNILPVTILQSQFNLLNLDTGKKYVWGIKSIDQFFNPIGSNHGESEPFEFEVTNNPIDNDVLFFQQGGCLPHGFNNNNFNGYYFRKGIHNDIFDSLYSRRDEHGLSYFSELQIPWQNENYLVTGGNDINGLFSRVNPSGSPTSSQSGDNNAFGDKGAHQLVFKATVRNSLDSMLRMSYAYITEAIHGPEVSPFFRWKVMRRNSKSHWDLIFLHHYYGNNLDPYLKPTTNNSSILYKDWSCIKLDLNKRVGQTLWYESLAADCQLGGHWSYNYLDYCLDTKPIPNLQVNDIYCYGDSTFLADASGSSNLTHYFISIEESDFWWNRKPATEKHKWFPGEKPQFIDLKQFYTEQGGNWKCNAYYRIKLSVSNTCEGWEEQTKLIYISCPASGLAGEDLCCDDTTNNGVYILGKDPIPGYQYQWSPIDNLNNPISSKPNFTPNSNTNYPVTKYLSVKDTSGCETVDTVVIYCIPPQGVIDTVFVKCEYLLTYTGGLQTKLNWKIQYVAANGNFVTENIEGQKIKVKSDFQKTVILSIFNPCGINYDTIILPPNMTFMGHFDSLTFDHYSPRYNNGVFHIYPIKDGLVRGVPGLGHHFNITKWELYILDRWGGIYKVNSGEVSSQKPYFDCHEIFWDGKINGKYVQDEVYHMLLKAENCSNPMDVVQVFYDTKCIKLKTRRRKWHFWVDESDCKEYSPNNEFEPIVKKGLMRITVKN